jgi:hypothetical protein
MPTVIDVLQDKASVSKYGTNFLTFSDLLFLYLLPNAIWPMPGGSVT